MEIVDRIQDMKRSAARLRSEGKTIALVPTMGALHEGHMALVREAFRHGDHVIVSIFINPIQFGPSEDLGSYPRDLEGDIARLEQAGVHTLFAPKAGSMYPDGFQTKVRVLRIERHLCGLSRPDHFSGVATVVLKLFNICKPHAAVFGMKDFQQVRVIERMVEDLDVDVRIVRHPTVREHDGLAMSSRNAYLSSEQRSRATAIFQALSRAGARIRDGESDAMGIKAEVSGIIGEAGLDVEYVEVCDPDTLDSVETVASEVLIAVAARLGKARLIDNVLAAPPTTPRKES